MFLESQFSVIRSTSSEVVTNGSTPDRIHNTCTSPFKHLFSKNETVRLANCPLVSYAKRC